MIVLKNLTMMEYQARAHSTRIYDDEWAIIYPALKLAGEAGEVAEKVGKALRDKGGEFGPEVVAGLKKELGDVLWYVAAVASDLGLTLNDVANDNLDKLASRRERGVIGGSGDNR